MRLPSTTARRRWLCALCIALLASCDGGGSTGPSSQVATIEIENLPPPLPVGGTAHPSAVVRGQSGEVLSGKTVHWASRDTSVVRIDAGTGALSARSPGTARIGASSEGVHGFADIVVTGPAASVEISPATVSIAQGENRKLDLFVRDALEHSVFNPVATWSTSNPAVATVTPGGVVSGVGAGSAQVTASVEGRSGSAQVTVTAAPVATVEITPAATSLPQHRSVQFSATLRDAAGNVLSGRQIAWSSSAPAVAEIGESGSATARGPGTAVITATSESRSGTAQLTVTPPVGLRLEVLPAAPAVELGGTQQFSAVLREDGGSVLTGRPVSWQSSDVEVAPVTATGVATGAQPGKATISATSEGVTGSTELSVLAPAPAVSGLAPDTATAGRTTNLTLGVAGSGFVRTSRVRWNGSDRPTVFVSSSRLEVTLTPTDLRNPGVAEVTVFTPPPGGGITPGTPFRIQGAGSIAVNTVISDEISPVGDMDEFTFLGSAREEFNVYFQAMNGTSSDRFELQVLDPRGNVIGEVDSSGDDETLLGQADWMRLPQNGAYRVRVEGAQGDEVGPYRFLVERIDLAPERAAPEITVGTVVTGEEVTPGDVDLFTFAGISGQERVLFFQAMSGSSADQLYLSLLAPSGDRVFYMLSEGNDYTLEGQASGRFQLAQTGTYTVRVEGSYHSDQGPYRFHIVPIDREPERIEPSITPGTPVSGEDIAPPGDLDQFTFTGALRQEVNVYLQFTNGASSDRMELRVLSPTGTVLADLTSDGDDRTLQGQAISRLRLPQAGTYRIQVEGAWSTTQGAYTFLVRPIDLEPEHMSSPEVSLGTIVTGEDIFPIGDVDHFTFFGTAGQAVNLYFQATSGSAYDELYLFLLSPGGDELKSIYSNGDDFLLEGQSSGRITLPQTGTYVVRVRGENSSNDGGTYRFQIVGLD